MRKASMSLIGLLFAAVPAMAQDPASSFQGFYAGPEIAAVDHHFVVEETVGSSTGSFNVTQWGVGGAAVAGYMAPVSGRLLAGLEGGVYFGGKTAATSNPTYTLGLDPRWGYSATARLGYAASDRVMLFGEAGYGGHRYDPIVSGRVDNDNEWTNSFVVGAGVEYAVSDRFRLRARFQHLDGSRNQFLIGLPIRF